MKYAALLLVASCYATVDIRADQIPKLSDARTYAVGPAVTTLDPSTGGMITYQGYDRSRLELLAPDGSTVVVKGDADLDIDMRDGRHYHFEHPIDAMLEGDTLVIRADDRAGRIALRDVARARVRSLSYGKTIGATVGIAGGLSALLLLVLL